MSRHESKPRNIVFSLCHHAAAPHAGGRAAAKGDTQPISYAHTKLKNNPLPCNYSEVCASNYILIELVTIIPLQSIPGVKVDRLVKGTET